MLTQLLPVLGTVIGALVAGLTTYAAGARRARTDLEIAERQTKTQLETARQQALASVEVETEKHRREKLEEAYGQLMIWIDELEGTINDVWGGLFAEEPEAQARIKHVLDEWPWETLRPPRDAAATKHYWSKEISELRRRFAGASTGFHTATDIALKTAPNASSNRSETTKAFISQAWDGRNELISILEEIRTQASTDILGDRQAQKT